MPRLNLFVGGLPIYSSFVLTRLVGWVTGSPIGSRLIGSVVLGTGSDWLVLLILINRSLPVPFKHQLRNWWSNSVLLKGWDGGCVFRPRWALCAASSALIKTNMLSLFLQNYFKKRGVSIIFFRKTRPCRVTPCHSISIYC